VWLAVTSISFDISVLELFWTLSRGFRVIVQAEQSRDTATDWSVAGNVHREHVTHLQCTPSFAQMLATQPDSLAALKSVRVLMLGGEPLPPALVALLTAGSAVRILNMYGPTETTVWSTVHAVQRDAPISIGRPIANTQVYLLDGHRQLVPVGNPGELYIGGDGVTRGYLKRPELTDERFVKDTFRNQPGARLYRTGDVARYRPDGTIEFCGRADNQVKLRGFRIELGEIEAALNQQPDIAEAVVVVRQYADGDNRLVAYFVPRAGEEPNSDDLRRALRQRLPEYMVPGAFVSVAVLPHTPNGKVDRRSLSELDQAAVESRGALLAARNDTERHLVRLWEDLLSVRPIGVRDNFFDLGGHSLLAVRLFAQIESELGKRLPLATLFEEATIEHLAAAIGGQATPRQVWPSLVPIQSGGKRPPFFCMHPIDGDVFWYGPLARHMGPDQPFYGLRARGLDGLQEPALTVEEMAGDYIREMRAVQPDGPYFLGGFSSGVNIALEVAQQLMASGDAVGLLAILDHPPVGSDYFEVRLNSTYIRHWLLAVPSRARQFQRRGGAYQRRVLAAKWKLLLSLVGLGRTRQGDERDVLGHATFDDLLQDLSGRLTGDTAGLPEHHARSVRAHYVALGAYTPKPYAGRITVFRAQHQPLHCSHDPHMGWDGLGAEVDVREVPGYHLGLVQEPHVEDLARALLEAIDDSRGRTVSF